MSAVVQLSEARDSEPKTAAEVAKEDAVAKWMAHEKANADHARADSESWPLTTARQEAEKKAADLEKRRADAEGALGPIRIAIGRSISKGENPDPHRERLRQAEAACEILKWQCDAAAQDVRSAEAAEERNEKFQEVAERRIESTRKRALEAEQRACFEALVEVGEQYDVRVRDLACQDVYKRFYWQGVAAIQARNGR